MSDINLFKTADLALAPFLSMNGLTFIAAELDPDDENKILFVFDDPHSKGRDLSMLFHRSPEKLYHEYWGIYRNELAKAKRNLKRHK